MPADLEDRLYLRVFDPDTGGDHDLVYGGSEDTETRYALFGGEGALSAVAGSAAPSAEELASGEPIGEASVAASAALDGHWQTIVSFLPEQGELVGGRRVFRLQVEGLAGNDANLYAATLSLRDRRNLAPDGLEIVAFAPTVRVPDDDSITELRFVVPEDAERLTVHNFDAANGEVTLASALRSVPLAASGQNEWRESEVEMLEREQRPARGDHLCGRRGDPERRDLPRSSMPQASRLRSSCRCGPGGRTQRPVPVADVELLANCVSVAFDASRSSDADDDGLSYLWQFGDGATGSGRALVHQYPGPGTYQAALRVLDASGQVGDGAVQPLRRVRQAAAGRGRRRRPGGGAGRARGLRRQRIARRRAADRAPPVGFL